MSEYFYTITQDGVEYRASCPVYGCHKAADYFGVPWKTVFRGAISTLPLWPGKSPQPPAPDTAA